MNKDDDAEIQRLTPLHYLVGGIVGALIMRWIYGPDTSPLMYIIGFVAWPVVFIFGLIVLVTRIF